MTLGFCDCNQGRLPCTCLPPVTSGTPMPACNPLRSESGLKPVAYIYTCRNPGQTSLLWAHQPPPFGHGWIDVKRVGLVREDEVAQFSRDEIDLFRQWFNAVEDLGACIEQHDRDLYAKLMGLLK